MAKNDPAKLFETELRKLEKRLDELVIITSQLKDDNRSLRDRQDSLINERASLVQKNEQVRSRVESMITRLKAMTHLPRLTFAYWKRNTRFPARSTSAPRCSMPRNC